MVFGFQIICHTHSLEMRLVEWIVHLKNGEKFKVLTCGMSPANMCSVYLWDFHEGPLSIGTNWWHQASRKKWSSWNWTNWTDSNGLVMLLWPLVDVETYMMYFSSWQVWTVAVWLIQPMAVLITLLEQHLDRQPTMIVTQATTWWEIVIALVKLQEIGLGMHLPVKVCYYTLCTYGPFLSVHEVMALIGII